MNNDKSSKAIDDLKKSIDLLILIELCKAGATRSQAREILGTLSNRTFSKVNPIFRGKENHEG